MIYVLSDIIFFSFLMTALLWSKLFNATSLPSVQVINFELPPSVAGYVHRIGRTGRAYNTGASISLVGILRCCSNWSGYLLDVLFELCGVFLCFFLVLLTRLNYKLIPWTVRFLSVWSQNFKITNVVQKLSRIC